MNVFLNNTNATPPLVVLLLGISTMKTSQTNDRFDRIEPSRHVTGSVHVSLSIPHTPFGSVMEGIPIKNIENLIITDEKWSKLERYTKGWDGEDADPPNGSSIYHAREVVNLLKQHDLGDPAVMPCCDGGVSILVGKPGAHVLIECFNDGEMTVVWSGETTESQLISLPDEKSLEELAWRTYEFLRS